ncbi:MAG: tetratricopeptide repeat protein [Phycisphaera sp.]|nr:tetratricopeptide repeat protein [Phycisphaera sp.]
MWGRTAIVAIGVVGVCAIGSAQAQPTGQPTQQVSQRSGGGSQQLLEGLNALETGQWDAAAKSLTQAIDADDENPDYWTARGVAYLFAEQGNKAYADLKRSLRLRPNDRHTQSWLAAVMRMSGDYGHASLAFAGASTDQYEQAVIDTTRMYGTLAWQIKSKKRERVQNELMNDWDFLPKATHKDVPPEPGFEEGFNNETYLPAEKEREQARASFVKLAAAFSHRMKGGENQGRLGPALFDAMKKKYDAGDYRGAMADLVNLRQASPNDPNVTYYYAGASLALGDAAQARDGYTRSMTAWTAHAYSYLGRASAKAALGDFDGAERDVKLAASYDAKSAQAYAKEVDARIAKVRPTMPASEQAALDAFTAAARRGADDAELSKLAFALARAVNLRRVWFDEVYQDRLRELEDATRAAPKDLDRTAALARYLFEQSDKAYGESVSPRGETTYYRHIDEAAEIERARQLVASVLQQSPKHHGALLVKANMLMRDSQYGDAETIVRDLMRMGATDPTIPELFGSILNVAAAQKRGEANRLRNPPSEIQGDVIITYRPTPAAIARAEQLEREAAACEQQALKTLADAVTRFAGTPWEHYYRGTLAWTTGKLDEARAAFERLTKATPNDPVAWSRLAGVYKAMGDTDALWQTRATATNLIHTSASDMLWLAWPKIRGAKLRGATDALDRGLKLDPASPRVWAFYALIAADKGKPDEAVAMLRAALALEEAAAQQSGTSLSAGATGPLPIDRIAEVAQLRLILAGQYVKLGKLDAVQAVCEANVAMEPRAAATAWMSRVPSADFPLPTDDPISVPESPTGYQLLAQSRIGLVRVFGMAGRADEVNKQLNAIVAYEDNWSSTVDGRQTLYTYMAQARVIATRLLFDAGKLEDARMMIMQVGRPRDLPADLEVERRTLDEQINQRWRAQQEKDLRDQQAFLQTPAGLYHAMLSRRREWIETWRLQRSTSLPNLTESQKAAYTQYNAAIGELMTYIDARLTQLKSGAATTNIPPVSPAVIDAGGKLTGEAATQYRDALVESRRELVSQLQRDDGRAENPNDPIATQNRTDTNAMVARLDALLKPLGGAPADDATTGVGRTDPRRDPRTNPTRELSNDPRIQQYVQRLEQQLREAEQKVQDPNLDDRTRRFYEQQVQVLKTQIDRTKRTR